MYQLLIGQMNLRKDFQGCSVICHALTTTAGRDMAANQASSISASMMST
jgi:hypothetical protein